MSNNLGKIKEDYKDLLPDLDKIDGLDYLGWDHTFECCQEDYAFSNFGVIPMYSIGGTGHDYLVMCPMPNMAVDQYPIAVFGEEEGTLEVIASSIKTWFPCYLVRIIFDGFGNLYSMLEHKDKVLEILNKFDNGDIYKWMEKILSDYENRPKKEQRTEFYKKADPNSYISEYIELFDKKAEFQAWKGFIKKYPFSNKGLYQLFVYAGSGYEGPGYLFAHDYMIETDESVLNIDIETAYEVFTRRFTHDFGGTSNIGDIIFVSSKIVSKDTSYKNKPFWNLINNNAKNRGEFWGSWEEFHNEGKTFEQNGQLINALICYENAFYIANCEEEFYSEALESIKSVAKKINDPNYLIYLKQIQEGTVSLY